MTIAVTVVHDVEAIQARHRKFIAEITKNLAPPHSEELNYEQQQWLSLRMGSPMAKPYRPFTEIEIAYKWLERTAR